MPDHVEHQLQPQDNAWQVGSVIPAWTIDWSTPPRAERLAAEEVIAVSWAPEVVFSLDRPKRKLPPALPAPRRQRPDSPREEELFSLTNLTQLNKGQLADKLGRRPATRKGPPPLPWGRKAQPVADADADCEAGEDSEALDALVRRETQELAPITAAQEELILSSGSFQTNMAITPRVSSSWQLEAALVALSGSLAAVLGTLAVLI